MAELKPRAQKRRRKGGAIMPHDMDKQFDPAICEELIGYTFRDIVAMYKDGQVGVLDMRFDGTRQKYSDIDTRR